MLSHEPHYTFKQKRCEEKASAARTTIQDMPWRHRYTHNTSYVHVHQENLVLSSCITKLLTSAYYLILFKIPLVLQYKYFIWYKNWDAYTLTHTQCMLIRLVPWKELSGIRFLGVFNKSLEGQLFFYSGEVF